jgi:hypothetical protein
MNNELLLQFCCGFVALTITGMFLYFIKCENEVYKDELDNLEN